MSPLGRFLLSQLHFDAQGNVYGTDIVGRAQNLFGRQRVTEWVMAHLWGSR